MAIQPDTERADDFVRGVMWVLQRDPQSGTYLSNSDPPVWFVPAPDLFDLPYVMYYTFDQKKVFMLSIRPADSKFIDFNEL